MTRTNKSGLAAIVFSLFALVLPAAFGQARPAQAAAPAGPGAPARSVGTVKSISGTSVTLTTDAGADLKVTLNPPVTMVRTAPGHKDLQGATDIQLQEIQTGDRMAVRGKFGDDGATIVAASAIVMKHEDIAQKQQQEQEAWRRGINGVVKSVDPAAGMVTITTGSLVTKDVSVHLASDTIIRRYAADSTRFEDAKPSALAQISVGDQLKARGTRSADGNDFAAQEIVSGKFRNLEGTVIASDAAQNTLTINDLLSKKHVSIKIGADSQLHKLPLQVAMGLAMRIKGGAAGAPPNGAPGAPGSQAANGNPGGVGAGPGASSSGYSGPRYGGGPGGPGGPGGTGGGAGFHGGQGDMQQMLSHMPAVQLSDLQKGDAVYILTTEGSATSDPTAIMLLSGVEPILTASPNDNRAAMTLSAWSLEAPAGEGGP